MHSEVSLFVVINRVLWKRLEKDWYLDDKWNLVFVALYLFP